MKFADILRNPHFAQIASVLSVPYRSAWWRRKHPHLPFWSRVDSLNKYLHGGGLSHPALREKFALEISRLLIEITKADHKLFVRPDDIAWLNATLESDHANVAMSMMLAMASCQQTYTTPADIAAATGTEESGWRAKASSGRIVGAYQTTKGQWLIPTLSLRASGVEIEIPAFSVDAEEPAPDVRALFAGLGRVLTEIYGYTDLVDGLQPAAQLRQDYLEHIDLFRGALTDQPWTGALREATGVIFKAACIDAVESSDIYTGALRESTQLLRFHAAQVTEGQVEAAALAVYGHRAASDGVPDEAEELRLVAEAVAGE